MFASFSKSSLSRSLAAGSLVSFSLIPHAMAQTADSAVASADLPLVVIAASRSQARIDQMPLHTTVINAQDIQSSPAQTLDQLLRNIPGMNFTGVPATQSDPTGHQTKMRGLGNAKVLVLLDGVPIHDPFYLTTQWFKVPLSNIERVEIVRGGNSSLWGNMAVAGVINIVSKRPKDNAGEVTLSLSDGGSHSVAISKNWMFTHGLSVNLALDQLASEGYRLPPADQAWRYPSRGPVNSTDSNLVVTTFYQPSTDLSATVRAGFHIQDQDISYQFGDNLQKSPDLSANVTKKLPDNTSFTASAWAQNVSFEKFNGASCYWQTTGTKCPSNAAVTLAQVNSQIVQYYTQYGSQRYREQGASAIYSHDQQGLLRSVQLGLDYRHLGASDAELFYAAPTALTSLQTLASRTYGKANQTFTGLFAQGRLLPLASLEVTASARLDRWSNSGRINTRTTAAGVKTGGEQPDSSKSAVNPSLALRYALSDDLSVRTAAYKSFRAPGFNNTTRTFGASSPTIANPDLGPENLTGRELGLDYSHGSVTLGATAFQYDIRNMIATFKVNSYATAPELVRTICAANNGANLSNCGGSASFYTNDQDGQSRGLELDAHWQADRSLSLEAAYTYTRTVLTRKGSVVTDPLNVQLAGTPKNVASLQVNYRPSAAWRTRLAARYIGRTAIDTTSTAGVVYEQGGNTVWDASVNYAWCKDIDISAGVVNLANKVYSESAYAYNQPWSRTVSMPRTATVGLKWRF